MLQTFLCGTESMAQVTTGFIICWLHCKTSPFCSKFNLFPFHTCNWRQDLSRFWTAYITMAVMETLPFTAAARSIHHLCMDEHGLWHVLTIFCFQFVGIESTSGISLVLGRWITAQTKWQQKSPWAGCCEQVGSFRSAEVLCNIWSVVSVLFYVFAYYVGDVSPRWKTELNTIGYHAGSAAWHGQVDRLQRASASAEVSFRIWQPSNA